MSSNTHDYGRAHRSAMLVMFAMGVAITASSTRFAEIKLAVGADDQLFGTVLSWSAIGGLLGTLSAARLAERIGTKRMVEFAGVVMMSAAAGYGLASTVWQLGLVAIFGGLGYSTMNVAINAQGVEIESGLGHSVMPRLHGVWSVGALTAALSGNLLTAYISVPVHLIANSIVALVLLAMASRNLLPSSHESAHHSEAKEGRLGWSIWSSLAAIAGTFALGMLADAGAFDWSAIHLHEDLGVALGLNSLGVTVFLLAQITGRLGGGRLVDRFGMASTVQVAAVIGATVYLITIFTSARVVENSTLALALMLVGIYFLGLGVSLIPAAFFAAAGRVPGVSTTRGIAKVTLLLNLAVIALKPVIATIANTYSVTIALATTAVTLLSLGWFGRILNQGANK